MLHFRVTPDDSDPYTVTAGTRDVLKWERTTKGASLRGLEVDPHMTDLYAVAHLASVRLKLFTGNLSKFEDTCELKVIDAEEEVDPTPPAA